MCTAYAHRSQVAIRVNDEFQTYDYDESSRWVGTTMCERLRYEDIHPNAAPADIYEAPDGTWTLRSISTVITPAPIPIYSTFPEYIQTMAPWEAARASQHGPSIHLSRFADTFLRRLRRIGLAPRNQRGIRMDFIQY